MSKIGEYVKQPQGYEAFELDTLPPKNVVSFDEVFIDEVGLTKKELRKYDEQNVDTYLVLLEDQVVSVVQVIFENENTIMD
ncbi:MAG: hypothetical protein ABEJ24_02585 [Candidatus Magasanikbacteria bacterium]